MRRPDERTLRGIAFFGGGTGGHLYPGVALAERARERFPGCRIAFFRTRRQVEDRVLGERPFEVHLLDLRAPVGGAAGWLRYSLGAQTALRSIRRVIEGAFDVGFGLGGYVAFPGIIAAKAIGMPVLLLEQNIVPGRVNRLLAPFVDAVACPFPGVRLPRGARAAITGNPLRREVLEAAEARRSRSHGTGPSTVCVVGGSQGATGINRAVMEALPLLGDFRQRIQWIHVTGDADKDIVTESYRLNGFQAQVHAFTPKLPELLAQSDLVLSRAGGTTVAEVAALGLPAVLVPYPHHRDQHQRRNAEVLVRAGAATLVEESECTAERLRDLFLELLSAPERLRTMGERARAVARPDASDAILDLALELSE